MLLTITTTITPASDLGFLLHKHPGRVQAFELSVGTAHVFYPEVSEERATAALLLEVDPVRLVRGRRGPAGEGFALGQYVNDRPYAASSMLSVAIKEVFRTALSGRSQGRQDLADSRIPLELRVPALPCRAGADLVHRVFEPLGWQVETGSTPLDPAIPGWGDSRYLNVRLTGEVRLADALNHLYVLLPVLDDAKHYWISTDEIDKLVTAGGGWLASHPERELITRRYLSHRGEFTREALARLADVRAGVADFSWASVAVLGSEARSRNRLQLVQQIQQGDPGAGSNVDHPSGRAFRCGRANVCIGHTRHVNEVTRLSTVPEHRWAFSGQRRGDEQSVHGGPLAAGRGALAKGRANRRALC